MCDTQDTKEMLKYATDEKTDQRFELFMNDDKIKTYKLCKIKININNTSSKSKSKSKSNVNLEDYEPKVKVILQGRKNHRNKHRNKHKLKSVSITYLYEILELVVFILIITVSFWLIFYHLNLRSRIK